MVVKEGVEYAAKDNVSGVVDKMAANVDSAMGVVVGAAAAASAAIIGVSLASAKMSNAVFEAGDRTGTSAEFMSQLGYAARQSGTDMATVEKAVSTLSKNIQGGSVVFERYGLSLRKGNGELKNTEELFRDAANVVASFKDPVQQSAAAQDLFSRAGKQLLPILRGGTDAIDAFAKRADELGVTISTTAAIIGNEFSNRMGEFQDAVAGSARELGSVFLPVATEVFISAANTVGAFTGEVRENRDAMISWARDGTVEVLRGTAEMVRAVGAVIGVFDILQKKSEEPDSLIWAKTKEQLELAFPIVSQFRTAYGQLGDLVGVLAEEGAKQDNVFTNLANTIDTTADNVGTTAAIMSRLAAAEAAARQEADSHRQTILEQQRAEAAKAKTVAQRAAAEKRAESEGKALLKAKEIAVAELNVVMGEYTELQAHAEELAGRLSSGTLEEIRTTRAAIRAYGDRAAAIAKLDEKLSAFHQETQKRGSEEAEEQARRDERFEISLSAFEENQRRAEEGQQRLAEASRQTSQTVLDSSISASQAFTQIGIAAVQGSITGEEAAKRLAATVVISVGNIIAALVSQAAIKRVTSTTMVLATGAEAAAQAGRDAGQAAGPAAVAVIPAVIAAVAGIFATLLTSFKSGGVATDGPMLPNGEILVGMTRGERALTVEQTKSFDRLVEAIAGRSGAAMPMASAQNIWLSPTYQQLVPERDSNFRRTTHKTVVPELRRAARDGLSLGPSRVFGPEG